jgi:hypothetical protein
MSLLAISFVYFAIVISFKNPLGSVILVWSMTIFLCGIIAYGIKEFSNNNSLRSIGTVDDIQRIAQNIESLERYSVEMKSTKKWKNNEITLFEIFIEGDYYTMMLFELYIINSEEKIDYVLLHTTAGAAKYYKFYHNKFRKKIIEAIET